MPLATEQNRMRAATDAVPRILFPDTAQPFAILTGEIDESLGGGP